MNGTDSMYIKSGFSLSLSFYIVVVVVNSIINLEIKYFTFYTLCGSNCGGRMREKC